MPQAARHAVRIGVPAGLVAGTLAWAVFIAAGGSIGMRRFGTPAAVAVFLVEILLFAYAGLRHGRKSPERGAGMQAGLLAGIVAALASDFPRTALLLLSRPYLQHLQRLPPAHVHMPWLGLALLSALLGASLAGAALGAACGSIAGSIARAGGPQLP